MQVNPEQDPNFCPLDSKLITLLFTFQDISPPRNSFQKLHHVTYPGECVLQFANCNPQSVVTMDVRTEFYNSNVGGKRDYLSADLTQLPKFYLILAFIYLCFLGFWVLLCFKNRHQPNFHKIHVVMGGLLVATVLNLLFAAADRGYVKVTGTSHGWNVVFYIFKFLRSLLSYFVLVLIGAGWSFLKPLRAVFTMILMILFILQCLAILAFIKITEAGPFDKNWETWKTVLFVVEIMCSLATVVPFFDKKVSKADAKAARCLPHDYLIFVNFMLVFSYLYCKILFWILKISIIEPVYHGQWVYNDGNNSTGEIIKLVFDMLIFCMLMPIEKNKFFEIEVEDELEVTESVPEKEEEFVLVCISRSKYEEAANMGLWDEEDRL